MLNFLYLKRLPRWAFLSLVANGLFLLLLISPWQHYSPLPKLNPISSSLPSIPLKQFGAEASETQNNPGEQQYLSYQQWVDLLQREAQVAATNQPENLAILLGDSLSLWFPQTLLPHHNHWLNQGISGETSAGLVKRLNLLDRTQPEVIYIMIGINDVIRGFKDDTIVANQELIVRYLKKRHPRTKLVIQSILPHSGEKATWEGRDRLLEIPNDKIQNLNLRLKAIADRERIIYLDLYSLFADQEGKLRTDLSTDGLHLNREGYQLWGIAIQVCSQLALSR